MRSIFSRTIPTFGQVGPLKELDAPPVSDSGSSEESDDMEYYEENEESSLTSQSSDPSEGISINTKPAGLELDGDSAGRH